MVGMTEGQCRPSDLCASIAHSCQSRGKCGDPWCSSGSRSIAISAQPLRTASVRLSQSSRKAASAMPEQFGGAWRQHVASPFEAKCAANTSDPTHAHLRQDDPLRCSRMFFFEEWPDDISTDCHVLLTKIKNIATARSRTWVIRSTIWCTNCCTTVAACTSGMLCLFELIFILFILFYTIWAISITITHSIFWIFLFKLSSAARTA